MINIILIGKLVNNIFDNLLIFHQLNMHKTFSPKVENNGKIRIPASIHP